MIIRFLEASDVYKLDHRRQAPDGTELFYEVWIPRGSRIDRIRQMVYFGAQAFFQEWLAEGGVAYRTFFDLPIDQVLREFDAMKDEVLGPNDIGHEHIAALHDLQYVPLEFRSRPEGSLIDLRTAAMSVHNTIRDPLFSWLPGWMETLWSTETWQMHTTATLAYNFRKELERLTLEEGDDDLSFVQWQGHDFSMRGMAGAVAGTMSGMAHLTSFTGTDTLPAIRALREYYDADGLIGGSVAATEHSVMSAGGLGEGDELKTFQHVIKLYPGTNPDAFQIVAVVSDTDNLWNVLMNIAREIKPEIMDRNGKFVFRPDSGDPVKIVCGDTTLEFSDPAYKGAVELLYEVFGGTLTSGGFVVLDSHVGVIYGDAINFERLVGIGEGLHHKSPIKFSIKNMVFGCGSYGYQYQTRDTFMLALKATAAQIQGTMRQIYKAPKTDDGTKNSPKGFVIVHADGTMTDHHTEEEWNTMPSLLEPAFVDGKFIRRENLRDIRKRLHPNWDI